MSHESSAATAEKKESFLWSEGNKVITLIAIVLLMSAALLGLAFPDDVRKMTWTSIGWVLGFIASIVVFVILKGMAGGGGDPHHPSKPVAGGGFLLFAGLAFVVVMAVGLMNSMAPMPIKEAGRPKKPKTVATVFTAGSTTSRQVSTTPARVPPEGPREMPQRTLVPGQRTKIEPIGHGIHFNVDIVTSEQDSLEVIGYRGMWETNLWVPNPGTEWVCHSSDPSLPEFDFVQFHKNGRYQALAGWDPR